MEEDNIKRNLKIVVHVRFNWIRTETSEHGNELTGCTESGKFIDQPSDDHRLKIDSAH